MKTTIIILINLIISCSAFAYEIPEDYNFGYMYDFTTLDSVYLTYNKGVVYRSSDYGQNWSQVHVPTVEPLYSFAKAGANIFLVGEYGIILKSSDMGLSWKDASLETSDELHKIRFIDDKHGIIGGLQKLFITDDGGESWQEKEVPNSQHFKEILVVDNKYVVLFQKNKKYEANQEFAFLVSEDYGKSWKKKPLDLKGRWLFHMRYSKGNYYLQQTNNDNTTSIAVYDSEFNFNKLIKSPGNTDIHGFYITDEDDLLITLHEKDTIKNKLNVNIISAVRKVDAVPYFTADRKIDNNSTWVMKYAEQGIWDVLKIYFEEGKATIVHKHGDMFFMQNLAPMNLGICNASKMQGATFISE